MVENTQQEVEVVYNARRRLKPSIPSAPLLTLRHDPSTGYGVFASQPFAAHTPLLTSDGPAAYVIFRAFRKEVCAWCFRYERGRNWKVQLEAGADSGQKNYSTGAGLVFCREECRDAWMKEFGTLGAEAYVAVEGLVQKQARSKNWAHEDPGEGDEKVLSEEAIEEAWKDAEMQGDLIRAMRLGTQCRNSDSNLKPSSKAQNKALANTFALPIRSTDTLFFILSGILFSRSPNRRALLMVNPSPTALYLSQGSLLQATSSFLHLLAVLPATLIPSVTRDTLEAILARDIANSFGIWSTHAESRDSAVNSDAAAPRAEPEYIQEEDPEMLGYGTWPVASFFNHACAPNVSRRRVGRLWEFMAAWDIPEGEELCISYIRGNESVWSLEERRARLHDSWGFTCQCQKCQSEQEGEERK